MDIEQEIFQKLIYNSKLSYNELWDKKSYPSSKLNYYLKQLVERKLVEKNLEGKYSLTKQGNQHIAEFNAQKGKKQQIPIACTFVLCVNSENKVLLQRRKKQPYLGILNIPGGKIQYGETSYDAGIRELYEESKYRAKNLHLRIVDEILTYYNSGDSLNGMERKNKDKIEESRLFAHIFAYVYVCYDFEGELELENKEGEMGWYDVNELLEEEHIFPNLKEIIPYLVNLGKENPAIRVQETKRYKNLDNTFTNFTITLKN